MKLSNWRNNDSVSLFKSFMAMGSFNLKAFVSSYNEKYIAWNPWKLLFSIFSRKNTAAKINSLQNHISSMKIFFKSYVASGNNIWASERSLKKQVKTLPRERHHTSVCYSSVSYAFSISPYKIEYSLGFVALHLMKLTTLTLSFITVIQRFKARATRWMLQLTNYISGVTSLIFDKGSIMLTRYRMWAIHTDVIFLNPCCAISWTDVNFQKSL